MYDKDLFIRICTATCSPEELYTFTKHIDKKEFNVDEPFKKYYGLKTILSAVEKFKNGIIDEKFFTCWCTAYNWIIMDGFCGADSNELTLEKFVIWEISEWLDGLSFYDSNQECCILENYVNALTDLDTVLRDIVDCKAAYTVDYFDDEYDCQYEVGVLIVNKKAKYFAVIYEDYDLNLLDIKLDYINEETFDETIDKLKKAGYTPLLRKSD